MKCLFSWESFAECSFWNPSAKLATLWFDEVILQATAKGVTQDLSSKQAKKENWSQATLDEVNAIWVDVHKYIPEYDWAGITSILAGREKSLPYNATYGRSSEVRNAVIEDWKQYVREHEPQCPIDEFDAQFDISKNFQVNRSISESIDIFFDLRSKMDCTFLSGTTEDRVLRKILHKPPQKSEFDVFQEFTSTMLPDITNWSWDKTMEIRNNPDIISFREKITSIWHALDSRDVVRATNILMELFYSDLEKFFTKYRPDPSSTLLKGVLSNIPLPIPVNPFSVYFGAQDAARAYQASREYGWLYFITGSRNT